MSQLLATTAALHLLSAALFSSSEIEQLFYHTPAASKNAAVNYYHTKGHVYR